MPHEHRHAHAGRDNFDLGIEDLLGLDHHLPLFLGKAVFHEDVDMGNAVESDLLGELLRCVVLARHELRLGLVEQLVHAFFARARHGLVGRHHHAANFRVIVQRFQRHHHLRRGTVRVGDDVLFLKTVDGIRVHFRYHQRHIHIVAELR